MSGIKNKVDENMRIFKDILNNSSLRDIDKKNIDYMIEYFQGKHNPKLASRSFLFCGDPGLGKTYLAEKLLRTINVEILYMGCENFPANSWVKYEEFEDLIKAINNDKKQIIFLDDLSYLLEHDDGEIITIDQRSIMQILNLVKRNQNKMLLGTLNDFSCLDNRMIDRIEVKIMFDLPSNENKKTYLKNTFGGYLKNHEIKYISENTIGYNFRDLPEMIRLAYRLGLDSFNIDCIKEAIKMYRPTQLYGYKIQNGVNTTLKDVIGKSKAKAIIERIVKIYQNEKLSHTFGLKRSNLLLFHGPPGTGKSFMATALAGEIGFPLIRIHARHIFGQGPFDSIEIITDMAKRYRNCIILVDEAEKLIGNSSYEDDNPVLGELHQCLDASDGEDIQSILIFAINNLSRFGDTLKDRFVHVPFFLPSFEDRATFFKHKIQSTKFHLKMDLPCMHLAKITENMSYRDMDRYWNDLMFHYLENKNLHPNDILTIVAKKHGSIADNEVMYS